MEVVQTALENAVLFGGNGMTPIQGVKLLVFHDIIAYTENNKRRRNLYGTDFFNRDSDQ